MYNFVFLQQRKNLQGNIKYLNKLVFISKQVWRIATLYLHRTYLMMVVRNVRPTNGWQWVVHSQFNSSFKPWRQFFQYPNLVSQRSNKMINIKYVFELTAHRDQSEKLTVQNWNRKYFKRQKVINIYVKGVYDKTN